MSHNIIYQVVQSATENDVERVLRVLRSNLDESITTEDKKSGLRNRPQMSAFLESHVMQTKYCLSIKKCAGPCEWCAEHRLPAAVFDSLHHIPVPVIEGDHYKKFEVSLVAMTIIVRDFVLTIIIIK